MAFAQGHTVRKWQSWVYPRSLAEESKAHNFHDGPHPSSNEVTNEVTYMDVFWKVLDESARALSRLAVGVSKRKVLYKPKAASAPSTTATQERGTRSWGPGSRMGPPLLHTHPLLSL